MKYDGRKNYAYINETREVCVFIALSDLNDAYFDLNLEKHDQRSDKSMLNIGQPSTLADYFYDAY